VTTLSLSSAKPTSLGVDALVIGVVKGDAPDSGRRGRRRATAAGDPVMVVGADDVVAAYKKATKGTLAATLSALGASGEAGAVTRLPSAGAAKAPLLVAVGLGDAPSGKGAAYDGDVLRRAAGAAVRSLAGTEKVAVALPVAAADTVAAVAEGVLLGAYAYSRYRVASKGKHKEPISAATLLVPSTRDKAAKSAVARALAVSAAVNFARDLVNAPPSDLYPAAFADEAVAAAKRAGVKVEVLDEKALAKGGYGGIIGVGQGSSRPPRLVKLSYTGGRAKKHLAIIGKGITFDTGGISLKPSPAMEWMKADMGGAAAVVAAVTAIAELRLAVDVTAWAPLAENMPSGSATRPSDVLTMYGGRTVEVLNTDAEGRLVLADALVRAQEDKPDLLIDAATLTGAQLVALGSRTAAIMSNDEALQGKVFDASRRAGEAMWPMPLPSELRKSLDSAVADISNMGDKYGGMLVAGLFLKDFVEDGVRWAHLDIAGPAWNDGDAYGYTPKGGTGAAVRTFVQIAEDLADGRL
jgi:leucyl aminopeptidase